MADEIHGQKMSDYTDIDQASELTSTEKAYYKANARVTTFGKVDGGVSTPNSNYNIPLSEISGDSLPTIESGDAGKVLTVNANEDGAQWEYAKPLVDADSIRYDGLDRLEVHPGAGMQIGSGALMTRITHKGGLAYDSIDAMYVVTGRGITNSSGGISIDFTGASENKVLSAHDTGNTDSQNNPIYTFAWNPGVPPTGTNKHRGEFLTVNNSDEVVWDTVPTAPTYTAGTGIDITSNAISVTLPVPDPGTNEHRGHVLTVNNSDDRIEWAAPQGGGGGGLPDASKIIGKPTGSGGDYALFRPYCNITCDANGNVETVGEIKWLWADVRALPDGYHDVPQ